MTTPVRLGDPTEIFGAIRNGPDACDWSYSMRDSRLTLVYAHPDGPRDVADYLRREGFANAMICEGRKLHIAC